MILLFANPAQGGGGSPGQFRPPTRFEAPRWSADTTVLGWRLSAHFQRAKAGVNVYKLTNGSYVEEHPGDESLVEITYHGGHVHTVSAAEKTALENAGYTVS